jgi:hypothetical protein
MTDTDKRSSQIDGAKRPVALIARTVKCCRPIPRRGRRQASARCRTGWSRADRARPARIDAARPDRGGHHARTAFCEVGR